MPNFLYFLIIHTTDLFIQLGKIAVNPYFSNILRDPDNALFWSIRYLHIIIGAFGQKKYRRSEVQGSPFRVAFASSTLRIDGFGIDEFSGASADTFVVVLVLVLVSRFLLNSDTRRRVRNESDYSSCHKYVPFARFANRSRAGHRARRYRSARWPTLR